MPVLALAGPNAIEVMARLSFETVELAHHVNEPGRCNARI